MYHVFLVDIVWDLIVSELSNERPDCLEGVGSAAVLFMRDIEHRGDNAFSVDVEQDEHDETRVVLKVAPVGFSMHFPLNYSFSPFPYTAADLLPFRMRSKASMAYLCRRMDEVLSTSDVLWLPWLGFLRFWTEHSHPEYKKVADRVPLDVLVPRESEGSLLALRARLREEGEREPVKGMYLYEVHPGRMLQLSLNHLPELGDGMDVRHVCPSCSVVSIYFMDSNDGSLTTEAAPCQVGQEELQGLEEFRDFTSWGTDDGMMPQPVLALLGRHGAGYFSGIGKQRPCSLTTADFPAAADAARLGEMSRKLLSDWSPAGDDLHNWEGFLGYDESLSTIEGAAGDPRSLVVPCTDLSKEVRGLYGGNGWFGFVEARMTAQRPALTVFQTKVFMKKLMAERGAPIPQLFHVSVDSPDLPWGPPLPSIAGGYVVKPAHLAESSNVFVIDEEGVNLLTGARATWDDVQGNMTYAWTRSLADYDQAGGDVDDQRCARSKRYGHYIQGRSCTNWALYRSPPGILIEAMVRPSMPYEILQATAFADQNLDIQWRSQPDEIKCHVVWGKVFVGEWVSTPAFLGFILRHGFVKDTIVQGPRMMEQCDQGPGCEVSELWHKVVQVAEAAVPPGVDYMRVDIFPNGNLPVVNELAVAGYSTMLEEWMLSEMLRRIKEGYLMRGFDMSDPD